MESVAAFLRVDSDGDGSGDGSGYGYDDGDGDGRGYGCGDDGDGCGYGYGSGSGHDDGSGDGSGYGRGYGLGDCGDGDGYGYGHGYENGDGVKSYCGSDVYVIDGIRTLLDHVHGNVAKGRILRRDLTTRPCWVVKQGDLFAHGSTLHAAMAVLKDKLFCATHG